jgi:hypothetical protein
MHSWFGSDWHLGGLPLVIGIAQPLKGFQHSGGVDGSAGTGSV